MTEFLLELYVGNADTAGARRVTEAARRAADELMSRGTPVRILCSIFVPGDETCFFLFEAVSADAVREAARRASLPCERVVEAFAEANEH